MGIGLRGLYKNGLHLGLSIQILLIFLEPT